MKRAGLAAAISLVCAALALVGRPKAAAAGVSDAGHPVKTQVVSSLSAYQHVVYLVKMSTGHNHTGGTTDCGKNDVRWATTDKGVFDVIVAAELSGKQMRIFGFSTPTCRSFTGVEDIQWVEMIEAGE
jgi:hypothetical protein